MSNALTVGISDFKVSDHPESVITTYALGSCIAVVVYDPKRKVGGMLHYMLPLSKTSPEKARKCPSMFADTGIPLLFEEVLHLGCDMNELVVKIAGGGAIRDDKGVFDVGRRNYLVARKIFWKNKILIAAEDVGGHQSRTVRFELSTGRIFVRSMGKESEL